MKKLVFLLIAAVLIVSSVHVSQAATKPEVGELLISPKRTRDGEIITINMNLNVTGPKNSRTKLWIDNGDGKGFQDFGEWLRTGSTGAASRTIILNCDSYSELEPGKSLRIGERALVQKIYAEYISGEGVGKVSPTVWHAKDCRTNPQDYKEPTGNSLFPFTLESILDTKFWVKPYPTPAEQPASVKFIGRYYDGKFSGRQFTSNTLKYPWEGWGTMHSSFFGPARSTADRIYINTGSAVEMYDKNTFLSRLANEPLAVFYGNWWSGLKDNIGEGQGYRQALLPWKAYFNVLDPKKGQIIPPSDSGFSHTLVYVDDRGYLYLTGEIGNIIIRDAGTSLEPVSTFLEAGWSLTKDFPGTINPPSKPNSKYPEWTDLLPGGSVFYNGNKTLHSGENTGYAVGGIKTGGKYYLVNRGSGNIGCSNSSCNQTFTNIFDVSDVMNPRSVKFIADGKGVFLKARSQFVEFTQAGEVVAALTDKGENIKIYSAADYVSGAAAKKEFAVGNDVKSGAVRRGSLAADEATGKFFLARYNSQASKVSIFVFSPGADGTAASYTETRYELSAKSMDDGNSLDYEDGYLLASGGGSNLKIWSFKSGQPQELPTGDFFRKYYTGRDLDASGDAIKNPSLHTLDGKVYLFVGGSHLGDVYELEPTASAPIVEICGNGLDDDGDGQVDEGCPVDEEGERTPSTEICGNGIDDDKDGQVDEGCIIYTPPPSPTSCTAAISFDKTSVLYGGSATETWQVVGADVGQVYGDCGAGATPISYGPQSYTFNNLTKIITCRVYGKIAGQEKCTASATVTVAPPIGGGGGGGPDKQKYASATSTAFQYFYDSSDSPAGAGTATLRQGSSGAEVASLQAVLNQKTSASLSADGQFGPKTKAAVISYQLSQGLAPDGVVGPKTRAALGM